MKNKNLNKTFFKQHYNNLKLRSFNKNYRIQISKTLSKEFSYNFINNFFVDYWVPYKSIDTFIKVLQEKYRFISESLNYENIPDVYWAYRMKNKISKQRFIRFYKFFRYMEYSFKISHSFNSFFFRFLKVFNFNFKINRFFFNIKFLIMKNFKSNYIKSKIHQLKTLRTKKIYSPISIEVINFLKKKRKLFLKKKLRQVFFGFYKRRMGNVLKSLFIKSKTDLLCLEKQLNLRYSIKNCWLINFHYYFVRKMKRLIPINLKKYYKDFIDYWVIMQRQLKYSIYYMYNIFIFKSISFLDKGLKAKLDYIIWNDSDSIIINISFLQISFYLLILKNYIESIQYNFLKLIDKKKFAKIYNTNIIKKIDSINIINDNNNNIVKKRNKDILFISSLRNIISVLVLKETENEKNLNLKILTFKDIYFFQKKSFKFLFFYKKSFFSLKSLNKKFFLWLFLKINVNKIISYVMFQSYNIWIFFFNYFVNFYLLYKLFSLVLTYFFFIFYRTFIKLLNILKLKGFEISYDLIKYRHDTRAFLGIKPKLFVKTLNVRLKRGLQFLRFYVI